MKVLNAKETVENLLRTRPELRDNDRELIAHVWKMAIEQKHGMPCYAFTARSFLDEYARGDFPSAESIRRSRAWLQQKHPELRGERYLERQNAREKQSREEIRETPVTPQDVSNAARVLSNHKKQSGGDRLRMKQAFEEGQVLGQQKLFDGSEETSE